MDPFVAFVAGVIVGAVLVVGAQAIRRSPSGIVAPGSAAGTGPSSKPSVGGVLARAESEAIKAAISFGSRTATLQHETLQITNEATGAQMRIVDGTPTIEVDGQTYHRLADVPEPQRTALQDELRRLDGLDLPEVLRTQLQQMRAGEAGAAPAAQV